MTLVLIPSDVEAVSFAGSVTKLLLTALIFKLKVKKSSMKQKKILRDVV